jgi:8-oxo-dGTP diphosphatase
MRKSKTPRRGVYEASGGLLWQEDGGERRLALVHRPFYDDWTLPKGTLKKKESWQEAALREVQEETACKVRLGDFAGCACYQIGATPKVVLFWHMHLVRDAKLIPNDEIDEVAWLTVTEALSRLSYSSEREMLMKDGF